MFFSKHYTSDMDITDEEFRQAESHMYYFYKTIQKMNLFIEKNSEYIKNSPQNNPTENSLTIRKKFIEAMDDDFGTRTCNWKFTYYFQICKSINGNGKKRR